MAGTFEERMEARVGAMDSSLMVQSGALSVAREHEEKRREDMSKMLKDLFDTVTHLKAVQENVTAAPARVSVPPGFEGADLLVRIPTQPKAHAGGDQRGPSEDPWAGAERC